MGVSVGFEMGSLSQVNRNAMRKKITGYRTIQRVESGIKNVRKLMEGDECHPDWGRKRIARAQMVIEEKENKLDKKRMSKPGQKTPCPTDKYSD